MLRRFISYSCIYKARMSSAFNECSAIRRFEGSDAIEIRDGITFDFYMGLPHIYQTSKQRGLHQNGFLSDLSLHKFPNFCLARYYECASVIWQRLGTNSVIVHLNQYTSNIIEQSISRKWLTNTPVTACYVHNT